MRCQAFIIIYVQAITNIMYNKLFEPVFIFLANSVKFAVEKFILHR